ncbi:thiolase family protein [Natronolimnobius sp. AArcel1]|uniref:thiolase family protein n=1 Tax=Natronolimnobius sp. AArcel1 TaxID=1679093 RepID=UPI0013EDDDAE|nr:thiolase family protein [Natronolimnobius sp. AArcel1]NGM70668.1 thiolase family protein [Natronolimnobius sp. AArcel1]
MTGVSITGVGMTPFTASADRSVVELTTDAAVAALEDASLEPSEATSLHVGAALPEALETQGGIANAVTASLGLEGVRADRVENTSASGASAVHRAVDAVASDSSQTALVVGVEKMSLGETADVTEAMSRLVHEREYDQGLTLPSFAGLAAGQYLERYDAPREALSAVAVKNHANAASNPVAQLQREITVEGVRDSPLVADPLRLYDCCPMSDGAAALVLSAEPTADSVHIASVGSATGTHAIADRSDPIEIASVRHAGERTFEAAGLEPAAVDVACIHDAFTILELLELEELGFYDRGTAWEATLEGKTQRDGELPVNPGGGLKARGHPLGATGISQLIELTWQLRGDLPDDRRVTDPEIGFAINVAGFGNNSVCTLLEQ